MNENLPSTTLPQNAEHQKVIPTLHILEKVKTIFRSFLYLRVGHMHIDRHVLFFVDSLLRFVLRLVPLLC